MQLQQYFARIAYDGPAAPTRDVLANLLRAHVLSVLDDCGWKVSGKGNAADRLGLSRTTLQSRMKKLEITRPRA